MGENGLSVLAIACSIAALATSLVVAMRSTPQRVRKAANTAMELAEETQNAIQVISNRCAGFIEEVTRERSAASSDLEEAERKRRQAAAKLSALNKKNGGEVGDAPKSLAEMLEALPLGDPRRLQLLRHAHSAAGDGL